MCDSEDSDSSNYSDSAQRREVSSHVLIAVDCAASMFEPSEILNGLAGFQTALRALYNVNDDLLLNKTTKNKIAIMFFHPDPKKTVLMDFESPFAENSISLKKLAFAPLEELDEYQKKNGAKLNFSHFLIECRKKFKKVNKNERKHFFFLTTDPDPSDNDVAVKFQALREFPEFGQLNITFDLLPLVAEYDFAPFFGEAYENILTEVPKNWYNEHHLTSRLRNALKFRSINKTLTLNISGNLASTIAIPCLAKSYCKSAKLLPNKLMTRDLQHLVIREKSNTDDETFDLKISRKVCDPPIRLTKPDKTRLYQTDQVKLGLTIKHASKKRYSTPGLILKNPFLLRPKASDEQEFNTLWEACVSEGFYLLCDLKHKVQGRVHSAEMIPKIINHQRQFLVVTMPHATDINVVEPDPVEFPEKDDIQGVFDELVKITTIEDYDMTKIKPFKFMQQTKYFKKELLGPDYEGGSEIRDLVNDKQYKGDIGTVTMDIDARIPFIQPKRGKSQTGTTSKRGKK